jgi:hypothetical protein
MRIALAGESGSKTRVELGMAEVVNLRQARKRADRQKKDARAQENRLLHGQPKSVRELERAGQTKAARDLDAHRIVTGDE